MADPLDGIQRKLDRADRHTDNLNETITDVLQTTLYAAVTERYIEEGEGVGHITVRAHEFDPHPVNLVGVVIGDIVHNLRSALDHLAWQLAILAGNDPPPDGTEFPVFWEKPKYLATKRDGVTPKPGSGLYKIRGLSGPDQTIIEAAQPYSQTTLPDPKDDPLWILHDLANTDKHRVCPVTFPAVQWTFYQDPVFTDCELIFDQHFLGPYEHRAKIVCFRVRKTGPDPKVKVDYRFTYTAQFAKDGPAKGDGVFQTIERMRLRVGGIVGAFASRFV